ncbi:hypothetical protein R9X47_11360 [Wukongibacter baidiensis]|uniref:hypothetical protein n=1 Tax=Wukongibacter baidiensis TaxID=1723361 RepID=UPI003D7F1CEB
MRIIKIFIFITILILFTASCSMIKDSTESTVLKDVIEEESKNKVEAEDKSNEDDRVIDGSNNRASELVNKILVGIDGVSVDAFSKNDVVINGTKYYYVEVVFENNSVLPLFVDVNTERLFSFEELDFNNTLERYMLSNLDDLQNQGIKIDESQSFWTNFNNWGEVKFTSCVVEMNGKNTSRFYLIDHKNNIVSYLPKHYGDQMGWIFDKVKAVAFKDLDNDNDKEIIIISDYLNGVDGEVPFSICDVYFQEENKNFITNKKLTGEINENVNIHTIQDIIDHINQNIGKELKGAQNKVHSIWNGKWHKGGNELKGSKGDLYIETYDETGFKYSLDACWISSYTDYDGKEYDIYHDGGIGGRAIFSPIKKQAVYKLADDKEVEDYTYEEYKDYKLIFRILDNETIEIEEIGDKHGISPWAGMHVKYSGIYKRVKE